ncbi:hypothetical protein [Nostoc sp. MG11]|uniref:hypothetical protein n=1 Tax=Nostoc sp. MG11 TaxID=2721166 RepID=UPI001D0230F1|nr:hypothetical protein [Nostoc sp. MG11]
MKLPEQQQVKRSLSDIALTRLLEKLAQLQPRTINLDIYRDKQLKLNQAHQITCLLTDKKLFETRS